MIQKLSIRNFALIDELEIDFLNGLTIITGETGAGKSILLGALGLLLGNRADSGSIGINGTKCIVEGEFDIRDYGLQSFFSAHELDFEATAIIRREVNTDGKSRAFVNDTPVNLSLLRELTTKLVEIHSQHETLILNNSSFQMMAVDGFAGNSETIKSYKICYSKFTNSLKQLNELIAAESKSKSDFDYYTFLYNEISDANLKENEQVRLELELDMLNNSESIKSGIREAWFSLTGDEQNMEVVITTITNKLSSLIKVYPDLSEPVNRLKSVAIELKDLGSELEAMEGRITFDPARVSLIEDRLDVINKLEQKHRVSTLPELMEVYSDLEEKLNGIASMQSQVTLLESEVKKHKDELLSLAGRIGDMRRKIITRFEKSVVQMLQSLGMPHASFKINITAIGKDIFRPDGTDEVVFLFSANKGAPLKELGKVASGGELSRLMLCIKSLLAEKTGLPTIIFDEIDTGVSGEVAQKVGNIIKQISSERQVIAITHLPQMAGKGDDHLIVYKETGRESTATSIRRLTKTERIAEIAKMLSGEQPTRAAIANARELLEN